MSCSASASLSSLSTRRNVPGHGTFQETLAGRDANTSCTMAERGGADKVTRIDEAAVKFDAGNCEELSKVSIKCLSDLGYDRAAASTTCKEHIDAYRECRRLENEAKRQANSAWFKSVTGRG